jgi:hypothetical protein
MSDKLTITYRATPNLNGFSITLPAGTVIKSREEAIDLLLFEYQWQCDEAPTKTVEIPIGKRY